jgi:hypothetical protein
MKKEWNRPEIKILIIKKDTFGGSQTAGENPNGSPKQKKP